MSEETPQNLEPIHDEDAPPAGPAAESPRPRPSLLGGVLEGVRHVGRDVFAVAFGRLFEPEEPPPAPPGEAPAAESDPARRRLNVLHTVTEHLRGAADEYLAAKLDEIEARVDQKLNAIEQRIDRKMLDLHKQLAEMRDRELRHRLRLLKLTLIFTVLVALLSLGYKWLERIWALP